MMNVVSIICFYALHAAAIAGYEMPTADSIFPGWNQATLGSLNRQLKAAVVGRTKDDYANRVFGFKTLMGISNVRRVVKASIRYKFLQLVLPETQNRDVFIVEANTRSATFIIRTFVITKSAGNGYLVDLYIYLGDRGWVKKGSAATQDLAFELPLTKYLVAYGKGFTYEDVIVSHWHPAAHRNISSEYFLFTTLSGSSGVRKLFEMYDNSVFK